MAEHTVKLQQGKVDAVRALKEKFGSAKDFIFTDYRGLTVEQITEVRNRLREQNAEYKVVKNNFARIAFEELAKPDVSGYLAGPTALALARGDSAPVAKVLIDLAKDFPIAVKGGLIEGNTFDAKQVEAFSKLPARPQLIAMLMGTMNAPLQNLVYVMNGVTQKLVRVLQAVADQKEGK